MPARILSGRFLIATGLFAILLLLVISGIQSYQDLAAAEHRWAELQGRIERVQTTIHHLERDVSSLQNNQQTVERVARQELGLVREGEIVLMVPEPPHNAPTEQGQPDAESGNSTES